jgi:hypothetical protein
VIFRGLVLVMFLVCGHALGEEAAPFTVLFDTTGASEKALPADVILAKKGWAAIAEDTLVHSFAGDAVFMNDRVAVVLRGGAAGVEVYSQSAGGCKERASLVLLGVDGREGKLSGVKIVENTQAAVMVEASVSNSAVFSFRLTAGESLLDIRGGKGAGRVRVVDQSEYVVVPDFFADDLVIDPAVTAGKRVGLPAENSVLGLCDHGGAIVACVWKSSRQNVDLLLNGEGKERGILGYEIDLPAEGRLWIAVMEGAGIWHGRAISAAGAKNDLALEWKPPMPARWRTDFAGADGVSVSTYFADPEAGVEPENAKSNGSCRFDGGRPLVRMVEAVAAGSPRLMVVYPVERTRATPLTAFCLVDVMRNALGVGPCQYVLDAEGLGNSESPTPDVVTHWVEKQFEKKAAKRDVDTIKELLGKMSVQVKRTDERALDYVALAGKVKQLCVGNDSAGAKELAGIAGAMTAPAMGAYAVVEKLANEVAAQAESAEALAKCQGVLAAIRTAGARQDYALAKLRMAARRLKQEARTLGAADAKMKDLAQQVEQQAEMVLVKK